MIIFSISYEKLQELQRRIEVAAKELGFKIVRVQVDDQALKHPGELNPEVTITLEHVA